MTKIMSINFEKELNSEQLRVVREASGPSLVLAGAGTGKTRTIVHRVAFLLGQDVKPEEILLLTFTNKAARAMMSRVEFLVGHGMQGLWGGTFHHVAARILRRYGSLLGYKSNFTILDEDDSRNLIKLAVKESGVDTQSRRFPSPGVLQDIFSFSRNSQRALTEVMNSKYSNWAKAEQQIKNIFATYTDKKRQGNLMDFDDLLLNFVLLLKLDNRDRVTAAGATPDSVSFSVRETLQAKWQHILVDEYQDTNSLQGELIKLLYHVSKERRGNAPSLARSLLVVGDDAQSIYSFRAATINNILEFPRIFPNTKIFRLETNYRSTTPILNLANEVIRQNTRQYEKKLHGLITGSEKPTLVIVPTSQDEARFIAEKILELQGAGIFPNKIAVLFRAAYQSEMLEFELAKRDIPYEYRGGMRFFERAHIKDVLAYLRVLTNLQDEISWLRILEMTPGIGEVTASRIFSMIRNKENLDLVVSQNFNDLSEKAVLGWGNTRGFFKKLAAQKGTKPKEVIEVILRSGYLDYLQVQYPNWQERLDDLEQLKVFAASYQTLEDFVGEFTLFEHFGARRLGAPENKQEMLVLSTIHQAKGLEWEAVFVLGLTSAAFPNRRALVEPGGIEEERRLFYVAITRARQWLFLSYPIVSGVDSAHLNQPSMFLDEIDQDLLQVTQLMKNDEDNNFDDDNDDADLPTINIGKRGLLRGISEL